MSKKTILAIFLILLGVSTGLLVIFAYSMSGGKATITLPFLAGAIASIITGSILEFSQLLDRLVNPVLDEVHRDLEDDIRDLKERRITNTNLMVIIVGIAALTFSFFVFRFHKLEAMWGPIPVVVPTIVGMLAWAWFIPRTRWFQNQRIYTPMWVFAIPALGFIFTLVVGLAKTENMRVIVAPPQQSINYTYNTYQYTGSFFREAAGVGEWGVQLELPSCDDDICGVLLVIALIVLTFVLVIGSALIPHFWLLSGSILISIMALIAIHDLRIRRAS